MKAEKRYYCHCRLIVYEDDTVVQKGTHNHFNKYEVVKAERMKLLRAELRKSVSSEYDFFMNIYEKVELK